MSLIPMATKSSGAIQEASFTCSGSQLMEIFRKQFGLEPTNGEVYIIQGKYYVAAKGCGRIAERKGTKGANITFINPKDFPDPEIYEHPKDWIICKATEKMPNEGTMDAIYLLNKITCLKDHEGKDGKGKWDLTDVYNFAQTKAIMRAQGKAYNIPLYEELPEEEKRKAEDLTKIALTKTITTNVAIEGKGMKKETPKPTTPPAPVAPPAKVPDVITADVSTVKDTPAANDLQTAEDEIIDDYLATESATVPDVSPPKEGFEIVEIKKYNPEKAFTSVMIRDTENNTVQVNVFDNSIGNLRQNDTFPDNLIGVRLSGELVQKGQWWNLNKVKVI